LIVIEFEIFDRFHAIIKTTIAKTRSIYVTTTTLIDKDQLNIISWTRRSLKSKIPEQLELA